MGTESEVLSNKHAPSASLLLEARLKKSKRCLLCKKLFAKNVYGMALILPITPPFSGFC